jgi:catalase
VSAIQTKSGASALTLPAPIVNHPRTATPLLSTPNDEPVLIEEIARLIAGSVEASAPADGVYRRDAHPKHHGIVQAWFTVESDVPEALKHGIFGTPGRYRAWIRFSNGAPAIQADRKADQRGMAIKLVDVPGPKLLDDQPSAHDFVLASAPRFFIRSVPDYVAFTRQALRKPAIRVLAFFFGWNPLKWRWHELSTLRSTLHKTADLLATRYWSQTPYRLGPHVVKYSAIPTSPGASLAATSSPDFLRDNLAARLRTADATFDFAVQRQTDPSAMPIDDATVEWDERTAPFQKVATIRLPAQEFQSRSQMAYAEFVSFSPWHALPAHEPLGPINRTRRVVYLAVASLRHRLNGGAPVDPPAMTI